MGKYVEILDLGVRLAARFHSHCPHTARLYYHPPSNAADAYQNHRDGLSGGNGSHAPAQESSQMASFCVKSSMAFDTTALILCSVV